MNWIPGASQHTWGPVMTADTTTSRYWLNWRVLVCGIWVLLSMVGASILIWRYEGCNAAKRGRGDNGNETAGSLYDDESWRPCLKRIHPAWLLAFRVFAFFVLLALLITNVIVDGGGIFYFYTQWTFTLVTIYFGLGSLFSIYGCYQICNKVGGDEVEHMSVDAEHGSYLAPTHEGNANTSSRTKNSGHQEENYARQTAGIWGYVFQVIYQTSAGAVVLTDVVFWLIIFPFLTIRDYSMSFLLVGMHSINAVFLLGDAALNSLRFPWFRISYFVLWTGIYVLFQWVIHACISIWWPYPFLNLSSDHAPIWYFSVALLHIPCYAIFAVVIKMKQSLLPKWFPQSY